MNPIHWWRRRFYVIHELHHRLDLAQDTIDNRNNLIAMQDQEITRLRKTIKTLQDANDQVEGLRQAAVERHQMLDKAFGELEKEREYWQGKAANP